MFLAYVYMQVGVRSDIQVTLITHFSKQRYLQSQNQIAKGKVSHHFIFTSDQEIITPYNTNTSSGTQVQRA